MSKQLFQDLLASFKRSNKYRKLVLAERAGYKNTDDYKKYLENQINGVVEDVKPAKVVKTTKKKPTIHIVDIIDCSGSMCGGKIKSAVVGINNGIKELKVDKKVNYSYTLCHFSGSSDIQFKYLNAKLDEIDYISFVDRGMTALYDAIGFTLTKVKKEILRNEKVLVNIYTDGGENGSQHYTAVKISEMIKELKDFTVTFIGTNQDVKNVIQNLSIAESNTLTYDGSAKGLANSLSLNSIARSSFSKSVTKGADVSVGFYKNVTKK